MKTTVKTLILAMVIGLAYACSPKNENSAQGEMDTEADSVEQVAPSADGMPTDGGVPSNPGSPADSAAQSYDSASHH